MEVYNTCLEGPQWGQVKIDRETTRGAGAQAFTGGSAGGMLWGSKAKDGLLY